MGSVHRVAIREHLYRYDGNRFLFSVQGGQVEVYACYRARTFTRAGQGNGVGLEVFYLKSRIGLV